MSRDEQSAIAAEFKRDVQAFEFWSACARKGSVLKEMRARSCMDLTFTKQHEAAYREFDFHEHADIVQLDEDFARICTSSAYVEYINAVQKSRGDTTVP